MRRAWQARQLDKRTGTWKPLRFDRASDAHRTVQQLRDRGEQVTGVRAIFITRERT